MKTSEVLRKAADEIRRRGWYQGDYGSDYSTPEAEKTCSVCALGAVNAVVGDGTPWYRAYLQDGPRMDAVKALEAVVGGKVHDWNDEGATSVEEVLDAFERAAQAAELEESSGE